jgi:hypothetical protein
VDFDASSLCRALKPIITVAQGRALLIHLLEYRVSLGKPKPSFLDLQSSITSKAQTQTKHKHEANSKPLHEAVGKILLLTARLLFTAHPLLSRPHTQNTANHQPVRLVPTTRQTQPKTPARGSQCQPVIDHGKGICNQPLLV